jgi:hypothetical protein
MGPEWGHAVCRDGRLADDAGQSGTLDRFGKFDLALF